MQKHELICSARRAAVALLSALAFAGCAPEGDAPDEGGALDEATSLTAESSAVVAPPEGDEAIAAVPSGPAGEVFNLVNQARSQARLCGTQSFAAAPALRWDDRLGRAAQGHSTDMATKNYFSHTSPDGRTFVDRIKAEGYTSFAALGENIAAGQQTPAQVVDAWLKSAGHCKNIMNPNFRDIGVGRATGGTFGVYWTQDFGKLF
ncbi:MAG TPA: CAP domain-containing protein [Polyangiaceae bacterium]|nr:CAP domain-containing protein [Polyangiaceae bacterium]